MAFISNMEMDYIALKLVEKFEGGRHQDCFDIDGFVRDLLGLRVEYRNICEKKGEVIGTLCNGSTSLRIKEDDVIKEVVFPKWTIVLDSVLRSPCNSGRRRFTLAHEASHYILDSLDRRETRYYTCEESFTDRDCENFFSSANFIEAQANRLASLLLVPELTMLDLLDRELKGKRIDLYGDTVILPEEKEALNRIANDLGVSYTMLFWRLMNFTRERGNRIFNKKGADELIEKVIAKDAGKTV